MSTEKKRILIVDDSTDDIHVVMESLRDEYATLVATSGEKALEMANKEPVPDVILMDVMMPGMNGYEACRKLKESEATRDIDVIFVSAHDTTEEKLQGFDSGGSDYLIKPVQPEVLLQKINLSIANKEARESIASDKDMAFQTAMTAMTSAGEQGIVLEFLRNSFVLNDLGDLARLIVDAISKYELQSAVQLRAGNNKVHAGTIEPLPPLEEELLTRLKDDGRIIEHGKRAIFNFGEVSVLIKNMPEDDDKRGRLRDHLAILFEGAEARLKALMIYDGIGHIIYKTSKALSIIEVEQLSHKAASQSIVDSMLQKLEASFLSWGLTEEQEELLINVAQEGIDQSLDHFEKGTSIDDRMSEIITELKQLI